MQRKRLKLSWNFRLQVHLLISELYEGENAKEQKKLALTIKKDMKFKFPEAQNFAELLTFSQWTNTRKLGTKEKMKRRQKREKRSEKAILKMSYLQ